MKISFYTNKGKANLDSKQAQAEEPNIQVGEYGIPLREVIYRGSRPDSFTYRRDCQEGTYIVSEEKAIDIIIDYFRRKMSDEKKCAIEANHVPQEWLDKLHASILNNGIFRLADKVEGDEGWIIFTSGGIKKEGMPHPTNSFFLTPEGAWEAYCEKLILFLQGISFASSSAKAFAWWDSPVFHYNEEGCIWSIYSRLLIS